jgi:hypothetical protein
MTFDMVIWFSSYCSAVDSPAAGGQKAKSCSQNTGTGYWLRYRLLVQVQVTGTGAGYWYRYRLLVQVQVTGTSTGYWYRYRLLVQGQITGTGTGYWYRYRLMVHVQVTDTGTNTKPDLKYKHRYIVSGTVQDKNTFTNNMHVLLLKIKQKLKAWWVSSSKFNGELNATCWLLQFVKRMFISSQKKALNIFICTLKKLHADFACCM